MIKICIGLPTSGNVKTETTASLMHLSMAILELTGHRPYIAAVMGTLEENRNCIVDMALKENCTHLLFIDSDMIFPDNVAEVLLEAKKQIIGCNAAKRLSGDPVIERDIDGKPIDYINNQISETSFVGMAVTLIDMEVFKVMPWPWFERVPIFDQRKLAGEDVYFCKKALQRHKIKTYCHLDLSMEIGHIGSDTKWLEPHIRKQIEEAQK